MIKKKTAAVKQRTTTAVKRTLITKKTKRKAAAAPSKKTAKPAARRKVVSTRKTRISTKKTAAVKSLGRPRFPGAAKLDLVFQKDYQAREIFAFLGVETVRELEQFGPQEIIERLTAPMVQTVDRIRKALALSNRALAGDREFAADFQQQLKSRSK